MLRTLITIVYIIVCAALAGVVLMQEGKQAGLGALSGAAPTFWDSAKNRSKEGYLKKITYILSALFLILSLALSMHPFG